MGRGSDSKEDLGPEGKMVSVPSLLHLDKGSRSKRSGSIFSHQVQLLGLLGNMIPRIVPSGFLPTSFRLYFFG